MTARRRRRATGLVVAALVAAALIGAGAVAALGSDDADTDTDSSGVKTGIATAEKRTMVDRETFDGALGYADPQIVNNRASGTLTRVAGEGTTVKRGGVLYRVDDTPVTLLYGTVPAYRTLQNGVSGPDVRQLQRNLTELGYPDGGTEIEIDGAYDWDTEQAVLDWQAALGQDETGRIELGQVVFLDGAQRMGKARVSTGAVLRPGQPVLDSTSTKRSVTVDLDARRQGLVDGGTQARVTLPGGKEVKATVTEVGAVAQAAQPGEDPTIEITLVLKDSSGVTALDSAPVEVEIASETRRDVLAVPITALLALRDGGYGVEVEESGGDRAVVAVEAGLFSDGYVEIRGGELDEGATVVVPT
ncbi:MAG: peptidoglycan-binding protein [Nocardioides sp.]